MEYTYLRNLNMYLLIFLCLFLLRLLFLMSDLKKGMKNLAMPLVLLLLCGSCQKFVLSNGKIHRQFLPVKDRVSRSNFDSTKFTKLAFNLSDYTGKVAYRDSKRIVSPLTGSDIKTLLNTKKRYLLYFWNPGCPGSRSEIYHLDSISKRGERVFIISMQRNYALIDRILSKTDFSQYPYYTIEEEKYTNTLLLRKIGLIRDACDSCYDQYKDDLAIAEYLLLESGRVKVVMHKNDTILYRPDSIPMQ